MTKAQLNLLRNPAKTPPVALIVDSPWIPGFVGISEMEYFTEPEKWLTANLRIADRFPDVIFVPGFWVEYGMATEPSAFGCKVSWWESGPPSVSPILTDISQARDLKIPHPENDGLMPFVLHLQKRAQQRIELLGYSIRIVAARGPLALATHLRGVTEFLMDIVLEPEESHKLLDLCTETVIRWLQAQADNLPDVEGILVLDDIPGLLSPTDYEAFAHPYLKRIFDAFPGALKIYHNDADVQPFAEKLAEAGFDILNFGHGFDMADAFRRIGDKVTLMGNVAPLDLLARGNPEDVKSKAEYCIKATGGRLILSAGGGVSSGTPAKNVEALLDAARGDG